MKSEKKRKRSSIQGVQTIMEPYKNVFQEWAYAGERATMQELFPESIQYWQQWEKHTGQAYFLKIPEAEFKNSETIKRYGENLKECREKRGWTLKEAAGNIGISFQQLQQIEMGNRKRIHRNYLLLFCGVYRISPEALMGLSEVRGREPKRAMVFYPEDISKKAGYVVNRLIYQDNNLLEIFCSISQMPVSIRNTLVVFLKNTPIIKIYNFKQINAIIGKGYSPKIPTDDNGEVLTNLNLGECFEKLCEASLDTPDLLDVYVSIAAADQKVWAIVPDLLSSGGFLPTTETEVER